VRRLFTLAGLAVLATGAFAAFDMNGIVLGAPEKAIVDKLPSALCKPLEWTSRAADRRCDDSKIVLGGVTGRVTFYLRQGKLEAFDVRFEARDTERMVAHLKKRYGAPAAESRTKKDERQGEFYKLQWGQAGEHAVLTSQTERRRASLLVWRGDFEEEIYRVR
jgi:hypothetical protein